MFTFFNTSLLSKPFLYYQNNVSFLPRQLRLITPSSPHEDSPATACRSETLFVKSNKFTELSAYWELLLTKQRMTHWTPSCFEYQSVHTTLISVKNNLISVKNNSIDLGTWSFALSVSYRNSNHQPVILSPEMTETEVGIVGSRGAGIKLHVCCIVVGHCCHYRRHRSHFQNYLVSKVTIFVNPNQR